VSAPSAIVLQAFGVEGPAHRLTGGQGTSWAAGNLVFKPDHGPLHEWLGDALAGLTPDGFRLATPIRARDGAWVVEGWSATRWAQGHEPDYATVSTWQQILSAGRAFHRAVARLDHPAFLDTRDDWWATADRAAWGEQAIAYHPEWVVRLRVSVWAMGRHVSVDRVVFEGVGHGWAPGEVPGCAARPDVSMIVVQRRDRFARFGDDSEAALGTQGVAGCWWLIRVRWTMIWWGGV
jgi:hypothetical protein